MRDEACIFCKIAAGEIPSKTLYEDPRSGTGYERARADSAKESLQKSL